VEAQGAISQVNAYAVVEWVVGIPVHICIPWVVIGPVRIAWAVETANPCGIRIIVIVVVIIVVDVGVAIRVVIGFGSSGLSFVLFILILVIVFSGGLFITLALVAIVVIGLLVILGDLGNIHRGSLLVGCSSLVIPGDVINVIIYIGCLVSRRTTCQGDRDDDQKFKNWFHNEFLLACGYGQS
jgi:hypothetical protein